MATESKVVFVRVPADLKAEVEARAQAAGQSLNDYMTDLIKGHFATTTQAPTASISAPAENGEEFTRAYIAPSFDPARGAFVPGGFSWGWKPRLRRAIARTHTLLEAEHGMGKTYTIFSLAHEMKALVWYFTASYGLERAALEGQFMPKPNGHPQMVQTPDGQWHVVASSVGLQATDGYITSAIEASRDGTNVWVVIDEFFFLAKDVEPNLFAAMDTHQGIYSIAYRGGSVRVGPNFRVIGSTNPPSPMYPEAETSNRALLSRFGAILRIPYPTHSELARYLGHISRGIAAIGPSVATRVVKFAIAVKEAQAKGELDNFVSPRDLKQWVDAVAAGLSVEEALDETVYAKFGHRYVEGVKEFWKLCGAPS